MLKTKKRAMGYFNGVMGECTKELGRMENNTEKESSLTKIRIVWKQNGKMANVSRILLKEWNEYCYIRL